MKIFNGMLAMVTALTLIVLVTLPFQPIYAADLLDPSADPTTPTTSATETTTSTTTTTTTSSYSYDSGTVSTPTTSYTSTSTSTSTSTADAVSSSYSGKGGTYIAPDTGDTIAQPAQNNRAPRGGGTPATMPAVGTYIFSVSTSGKHQFSIVIDGVLHKIPADPSRPAAGESITYNASTKAFTAVNGTFEISGHLNSAGGVADIYIHNKVTGFKAMIDISWNLSTGAIIGQYDVRMIPLGGDNYRVDAFSWNYTPEKHYANYFINPTAAAELYAGARNETYTNLINLITSKSYLRQTYDFMTGTNIPNQSILVYSTKDVTAGPFIKRASFTQGSALVDVINPAGGPTFKVALQQQLTVGSKTYQAVSLYPAFHGIAGPVYGFGMFFYDMSKPFASQTPAMSSTFPSPGNPITVQVEDGILSISVSATGVLTAQKKLYDAVAVGNIEQVSVAAGTVNGSQAEVTVQLNGGASFTVNGTLDAQNRLILTDPQASGTFTFNADKTALISSVLNLTASKAMYVKTNDMTLLSTEQKTSMMIMNIAAATTTYLPSSSFKTTFSAGNMYAQLSALTDLSVIKDMVRNAATSARQEQTWYEYQPGSTPLERMTIVDFTRLTSPVTPIGSQPLSYFGLSMTKVSFTDNSATGGGKTYVINFPAGAGFSSASLQATGATSIEVYSGTTLIQTHLSPVLYSTTIYGPLQFPSAGTYFPLPGQFFLPTEQPYPNGQVGFMGFSIGTASGLFG